MAWGPPYPSATGRRHTPPLLELDVPPRTSSPRSVSPLPLSPSGASPRLAAVQSGQPSRGNANSIGDNVRRDAKTPSSIPSRQLHSAFGSPEERSREFASPLPASTERSAFDRRKEYGIDEQRDEDPLNKNLYLSKAPQQGEALGDGDAEVRWLRSQLVSARREAEDARRLAEDNDRLRGEIQNLEKRNPLKPSPQAIQALAQQLKGMVAAEIDRARENWMLMSKRIDDSESRLVSCEQRLIVAAVATLSSKERQQRSLYDVPRHSDKIKPYDSFAEPVKLGHTVPYEPAPHDPPSALPDDIRQRAVSTAVRVANREKKSTRLQVLFAAWRSEHAHSKHIREVNLRLSDVANDLDTYRGMKRKAVRDAVARATQFKLPSPWPTYMSLFVAIWQFAGQENKMKAHVEEVGKHALSVVWTARNCVKSWMKLMGDRGDLIDPDDMERYLRDHAVKTANRLLDFKEHGQFLDMRCKAYLKWRLTILAERSEQLALQQNYNGPEVQTVKEYCAKILGKHAVEKSLNRVVTGWAFSLAKQRLIRLHEGKQNALRESHEATLDAMQRAADEGADARLEVVAAKFRADKRRKQLNMCVELWDSITRSAAAVREKEGREALMTELELQKEQAEREKVLALEAQKVSMDELLKKERAVGDKTSELMATKYKKTKDMEVLQDIVTDWAKYAKAEVAKRQKEKELEEMKQELDMRGEKTRERLGQAFIERRNKRLVAGKYAIWTSIATAARAEKIKAAELAAQQSEIDQLKEAYRQKEARDDNAAEVMGNKFRDAKLKEIVRELYSSWMKDTKDLTAKRRLKEQSEQQEAKLEKLKATYADKGMEQAERMAAKFRKEKELAFLGDIINEWSKSAKENIAKKKLKAEQDSALAKIEAERKQGQKELDKLKKQYTDKNEETAERMATQFATNRLQNLLQNVMAEWTNYFQLEKSSKKATDELNRLRDSHREKGDETANRIAEQYRQVRETEAMQTCFKHLFTYAKSFAVERAKDKEREIAKKEKETELENLRQQHRKKGDATAEKIAREYRAQREADFLQKCFRSWESHSSKIVAGRNVAKERELGQQQKEAELELLRTQHREMGDANAERMAKQFREVREARLLERIMGGWCKSFEVDKTKKEGEANLKSLRKQYRKKNEATAEAMATQFRKSREFELLSSVFAAFSTRIKQLLVDRRYEEERTAAKQQSQEELEKLRSQHRELGDATAERMAKKFLESRQIQLVQQCFMMWEAQWDRAVNAQIRADERLASQQELEQLKSQHRERGDANAEKIAQKFREVREVEFTQRCMTAWHNDVHKEHSKRLLREKKEQVAYQRGAELARLHSEYQEKGARKAEKIGNEYSKVRLRAGVERCFTAWDKHVNLVRLQKPDVDDLEKLKKQRRGKGDEIAEKMAAGFRKVQGPRLIQKCLIAWAKIADKYAIDRTLDDEVVDAQKQREAELELLLAKEREPGDATAEQIARKFLESREFEIMKKYFDEMYEYVSFSSGQKKEIDERKMAKKENDQYLAQVRRQQREKGDATAEAMAKQFRVPSDTETLLRFIASWFKQAHLTHIRKQAQRELEDARRLHRRVGDEGAELMAIKFRAIREIDIAEKCWSGWSGLAQHTSEEKARKTARAAAAEKMAQDRMKHLQEKCVEALAREARKTRLELQREKAKLQYDKDIEEIKTQQSANPGEMRSLMAGRFREYQDLQIKQSDFNDWYQEHLQCRSERKYRHHVEYLHLQYAMLRHGDNDDKRRVGLKLVKEYLSMKESRILKDCFLVWLESAEERLLHGRLDAEREQARRAAAFELELLRNQPREVGGEQAELMAELHVKSKEIVRLRLCFVPWQRTAEINFKIRILSKLQSELGALSTRWKSKGGLSAEKMALRCRKARLYEIVQDCFVLWAGPRVNRQQLGARRASLRRKAKQDLQKLRSEYREDDAGITEEMANKFREIQLFLLFGGILYEWSTWARAQAFAVRELRRQDDLETLRNKDRKPGDDTAEEMAMLFRKHVLYLIQHEVLSEWCKAAAKSIAATQLRSELQALRERERKHGDGTAEIMARKFRRHRDADLLRQFLADWLREVREAQQLVPVEYGVQADVLTVTSEEETSLQVAYLRAKVDVSLKEVARLESEKAILRMEVASQRRRADGAVHHASVAVNRASKVLYFRSVRFRRERTFLRWAWEVAKKMHGTESSVRQTEIGDKQLGQRTTRDVQNAVSAPGAPAGRNGLWVAVDGGPFQVVDPRWPTDDTSALDQI